MRGTRWFLLVIIAAIVAGVSYEYRQRLREIQAHPTAKPAPLPPDLMGSSQDWSIRDTDHHTGRVRFDLSAKDMQQPSDATHVDLKGVVMKVYSKVGKTYDLVKSAAASFDVKERNLYSQGDTEITLNIPLNTEPTAGLTVVHTSGVTFDSNTGRADTDQPATFAFEKGDGKSTGATYDPTVHQLEMKHDVQVHWRPLNPHAKPALIEAGSLSYHESTSEIWLKPWGKVTRENTVVEGTDAVIQLEKRVIHRLTALKAHGTDDHPLRKLSYAADELAMDFNEHGVAKNISGNKNAELVSTTATTETTVTGDHVDLEFEPENHEAILTQVKATGNAVVTAKPLPAPGRQLAETHILRSQTLEMKMRPGGREVASVATNAPGQLEFVPNLPTQRHRTLDGSDFVIAYAAQNRLDRFHATNVRTTTEPTAEERRRNRSTSSTTSRAIDVRFDPRTGRMATIQQSGDFTYEEADRRARAATANLDSDQNEIQLDTGARINDATSSTTADRIRLDQRTGDFTAEGSVNSSRLPDKSQKKSTDMLSGDEPLLATARKMDSRNRNQLIHYEGGVTLWQGANKIQADTVDIDRDKAPEKRTLIADGNVVTTLWETPKPDPQKKKSTAPLLTETRAPHLVYTETDRLAYYTGGVVLTRPDMQVKSRELRAYLAAAGAESSLEKAFADGNVEIFSHAKDRTRNGTGDDAEYYPDEQKVILRGTWVKMVEQVAATGEQKTSEGRELTWFPNDARLLVIGGPEKPGISHIVRKKGK